MIDIGARRTEQLLPYGELREELMHVMQLARGGCVRWVERGHITLDSGTTLYSMVAADDEILVNKTVTLNPANPVVGRRMQGGQVSVFETAQGSPLMVLDGPTLTSRRTAAVSSIAITGFLPQARSALVVGYGMVARAHVQSLFELNGIREFAIAGRDVHAAERLAQFARGLGSLCSVVDDVSKVFDRYDVVLTATSSETPVLPESARGDQLIIAVGSYKASMAELPPGLVTGAESIVVDNLDAARSEAGELIQADIAWHTVQELSNALGIAGAGQRPHGYRIFKSVGHSLWDLAAARLAWRGLSATLGRK